MLAECAVWLELEAKLGPRKVFGGACCPEEAAPKLLLLRLRLRLVHHLLHHLLHRRLTVILQREERGSFSRLPVAIKTRGHSERRPNATHQPWTKITESLILQAVRNSSSNNSNNNNNSNNHISKIWKKKNWIRFERKTEKKNVFVGKEIEKLLLVPEKSESAHESSDIGYDPPSGRCEKVNRRRLTARLQGRTEW